MSTCQRLYTIIFTSFTVTALYVVTKMTCVKRTFLQRHSSVNRTEERVLWQTLKVCCFFIYSSAEKVVSLISIRRTLHLPMVGGGTDGNVIRCFSVIPFEILFPSKLTKQSWGCCLWKEQWDESNAASWYCCWDFFSVHSISSHFLEHDTEG